MSNNILQSKSDAPDPSTESAPSPPSESDTRRVVERTTAEEAVQRARLYSLLSIGFDRPGEELEALLNEGVFTEDIREAAGELDDKQLTTAVDAMIDEIAGTDSDDLYFEWGSLFGVEEGVTVSQYELTYLPGPLMTTAREIADINGFYKAFNLALGDGENDRKDLLVFQLEFLSHLCLREAYLRQEGDDEGVEVVVDARRSFVEEHLGRWFWRFADEVCKHDDDFYAALTDLLSAFVEAEIDVLDVDPEWVPDDPEVIEWNEDIFGDSGRGCGGCGMGDDSIEEEFKGVMPSGPPDQSDLSPEELDESGPN
ncbi:TorD/DmsD family molecular chaperone [Halovenus sp. HT40]|uniref:TorD/DmsD family molecular chaperone n=1 Tax=Halovenus sp. HT40 TaxID=3126691 RepID=UPI00300F2E04